MVATPNLFFFNILFLVCHPVAISVVTDDNFIGEFRKLDHLIKYIKLMWLFQFVFFSFSLLFSSYIYLFYFILLYVILVLLFFHLLLLLLYIFLFILDD